MSVATYNPGDVDIYLAILHQVTGFSPNSLIKITRDNNFFNTFQGASGKTERITVPDNTYTLEISLSQTSPSNAVLNGFSTLDHLSGRGIFPLFAKDASGDSLFLASSCWIESPAEASYGTEIEDRKWTIKCADMVFGLAGNGDTDALEKAGQLRTLITQFGGNRGLF